MEYEVASVCPQLLTMLQERYDFSGDVEEGINARAPRGCGGCWSLMLLVAGDWGLLS